MGGKTGTTTSQVSIPPDVLARYNSVNAQAQQVAATPFQPYTGQFVAGLTPTQQAGIQATSQYSQTAQPYYQAATGQLMGAQQSALPGMSAAYQNVGQAQNVGQQLGEAAGQYYGGAANAAMPYYGAMEQGIGGALSYAQPLNTAAQQAAAAATGAAQPYYGAATAGTAEAVASAQPYQEAARQGLGAALQYSGGINQMAPQLAYSSYGATQPIMGEALSGTQAARQAGAPYQQASTQAALAGAQGVNPEALNIGAYMSPYTQAVADATYKTMRQQQEQEMGGQLANAIRSGAFGGDRAALAAANLARQQELATAQAMAPIYQQGYAQALGAAQQQQGVGLSAAQANRAAMQNLAAQLQGIGQQGYAQQLGAAGQIGQLGQNIYGQGLGTAQALSQMGQTGFGQQLQAAQAQAALGQQAYGQQLGAAQQFGQLGQNIYGMGANQANLLSQLGQTGYGQQLGAAQQYGNIGQNLYQMGLGTGQAIQGLGQQQYAQGMGAAQQLAGLAQQGYGMGAATSQALAGLGTQAQQAGLQGAQAQMGAGTLEQQTQQADLTARYQQFLQERGYPFQVAQFLANIAMGTGALSGSTTTTTQPMPFFSDRRVKDDVKEIGKTHDGQPIYSFKYNGDDRTQIGLMAQDVEKKHPEAVGEYGGIKTVDYKEATKDAERSERYAGGLVPESMGGAVNAPGAYARGGYADGGLLTDPNDIQALLAQQQSAFGPFGEGGLYGGTQHQAPYMSAKGVVPQTRLHTPKLIQAGTPPRLPESGASQVMGAIDSASKIRDQYQKVKDVVSGIKPSGAASQTPSQPAPSSSGVAPATSVAKEAKDTAEPSIWDRLGTTIYDVLGRKDGGVVPREHYAIGGSKDPALPYEEDDKSPYKYFPTEILDTDKPELAKAGQPPSPTSQTGVGLGDVAKIASMFFLKDGGVVPRDGLQEGGSPDIDKYLNAIAQIESSGNYDALGPRTKTGDRAYGKYQVMGANVPSWTEEAVGKRMTPEEFLADKQAQETTARHHFGKALNQYGTPEDAASVWFSGRPMSKAGNASDITGTTVPEYINRFRSVLGESDVPARNAVTAQGVKPQAESQGVMPSVQNWLTENQSWLSPLGAGLKGMVQSKSPFLGAAVLEGVGSGLESLGSTQEQAARTGLVRAQQQQTLAGIPNDAVLVDQMGRPYGVKVYVNGELSVVDFDEYQRALAAGRPYKLAPSAYGMPSQAGAPKIEAPDIGAPVPSVGGEQAPPASAPAPATPQPQTAPAPTTGQPAKPTPTTAGVPLYREGSPDVQNIALEAGQRVRRGGIKVLGQSPSANPFDAQTAVAADAAKDTLQRNTLTASLGNLPRSGSFLTSGAFGANVGQPVVDWVNSTLGAAGADFKISKPEDLANAQVAQKISTLLATRRTSESGQRAYGALEQILSAVPSMYNTPEGQANLLADLYITQQREIDLDRFYRNVRNTAEKTIPGFTPVESQFMGQGLYDQFANRMEEQYAKEKQDLQKLYMKPLRITDPNTNQVTETYILPYLAKTAGNVPEEVKQEIIKRYGVNPELFRYFSAK